MLAPSTCRSGASCCCLALSTPAEPLRLLLCNFYSLAVGLKTMHLLPCAEPGLYLRTACAYGWEGAREATARTLKPSLHLVVHVAVRDDLIPRTCNMELEMPCLKHRWSKNRRSPPCSSVDATLESGAIVAARAQRVLHGLCSICEETTSRLDVKSTQSYVFGSCLWSTPF